MFIFIKTIIAYFFWAIISFIFTILCIPFALFPKSIRYDNRFYFFLTTIWNKLLLFFSFIQVEIEGKDNLPKYAHNPSIIIANHSSSLDIFLLESIVTSYPHIWLTKDIYSKIPFFNILVKKMHISVKRDNPISAVRSLYKVYDLAKGGARHVIMFPEGKRYSDGKVHNFLPGFAILSKKLKRPVIPVAISGLHKIFPKKQLLIDSRASKVKLVIGKPFFYEKGESEKEFIKKIHDWFAQKLLLSDNNES